MASKDDRSHDRFHYRTIDSPIGPLTLVGRGPTLTNLRMAEQSHEPDRSSWQSAEAGAFDSVVAQLDAYFAGDLNSFDVAVELTGTSFQRRVWAALQTIAYGETRTYGQVAEQIGAPGAARAVGLAIGRNPVSIIVPCHRVIGSSGRLTGYAAGLDRKRTLLALEKGEKEMRVHEKCKV
jgi:methylated-DNA-[protein]-cysteine S-methyltransferase